MTAQADRNQSEAKKAEAGPKQRKLLKTMDQNGASRGKQRNRNGLNRRKQRPKRRKPRKTTTETAQAAENEAKQNTSIATRPRYFTE